MQAIASSRLQKTLKTHVLQALSHLGGSRGQFLPANCRIRIEIEYDPVGLLKGRVTGTPWMQLKHSQLSQLDEGLRCGERDIRLERSCLSVGNVDAANVGGQHGILVLLIEA